MEMTEVCWRMLSDDNNDSLAKCRERRQRRIEMRRLEASSPPPPLIQSRGDNPDLTESLVEVKRIRTAEKSDLPASSSSSSGEDVDASSAQQIEGPAREPVFGTMSMSGRSRGMEDALGAQTSLCRPEISHYRLVHFFTVFDGHGGPHVLLHNTREPQNLITHSLQIPDILTEIQVHNIIPVIRHRGFTVFTASPKLLNTAQVFKLSMQPLCVVVFQQKGTISTSMASPLPPRCLTSFDSSTATTNFQQKLSTISPEGATHLGP